MISRALFGGCSSFVKASRVPSTSPAKATGFSVSRCRFLVLSATDREPLLSKSWELSFCNDVAPKRKLEFGYTKGSSVSFCSFIENTPSAEVVGFFREVMKEVEQRRQLMHFHLRIRDVQEAFRVDVFYGEVKEPPRIVLPEDCISCFSSALLYPGLDSGITAGECILEELVDPYAICRLDAKARSGFVVTPKRHVEKLSDLDDGELFAMLNLAVRALRHSELSFLSMILNHGNYQSIPHLHLKVWVDNEEFETYRLMKWSDERKLLWNQLYALSLKRQKKKEKCLFFKKQGSCRHGDLCSFSHTN